MNLDDQSQAKRKKTRLSGIPIDQLDFYSCRYVVSPDNSVIFRFCGEVKTRGSYCEKHAQLCYIPVSTYKKYKRSKSNDT